MGVVLGVRSLKRWLEAISIPPERKALLAACFSTFPVFHLSADRTDTPMPLSDISVRNAKPQQKPAKLFDGGGLFLFIAPTGGKMWRLKYRFKGKEKLLALGVYPDVGLKRLYLKEGSIEVGSLLWTSQRQN